MELVLQNKVWYQNKKLLIAVIIIFAVLLFPNVVAVADGLGGYVSEKLIGRSGVADSQLIIGMDGVNNSRLDIALGGSHFHADDAPYMIVSLAPLLFVALGIILLLGLFRGGGIDVKVLVIGVVAIYLLTALLTGMQDLITGLLR